MITLDTYFDRIFCINLERSPDRWQHVLSECHRHGINKLERFRGYDFRDYQDLPQNLRNGMDNAMFGCTASHGALLHAIAWHRWKRVLILEDDFEILHEDFNEKFDRLIRQVPDDWELLYLGAGYAEKPIARIGPNVIKVGAMKTTSSYAITGAYARYLAPFMCGGQAPDDCLSGFNALRNAYVLQPRLMGQYESLSVIWGNVTHNTQSMTDTRHEKMV